MSHQRTATHAPRLPSPPPPRRSGLTMQTARITPARARAPTQAVGFLEQYEARVDQWCAAPPRLPPSAPSSPAGTGAGAVEAPAGLTVTACDDTLWLALCERFHFSPTDLERTGAAVVPPLSGADQSPRLSLCLSPLIVTERTDPAYRERWKELAVHAYVSQPPHPAALSLVLLALFHCALASLRRLHSRVGSRCAPPTASL